MERRLGVLAGALIAVAARTVAAAPATAAAKAAFAEGVAHYQRGEWESASGAFASAYALEPDADALFAWAQAERKLGHCAKALALYDQVLAMPALPVANARAVATSRADCAAKLARPPPVVAAPPPPPADEPAPPPVVAEPEPPPNRGQRPVAGTRAVYRPWYRSGTGDALALTGVVALGAGTALVFAGRAADSAKTSATTYGEFRADEARARRDARIGTGLLLGGGALLAGGIVWFATHRTLVVFGADAVALRGTF